jgi:hypothetical protein
MNEPTASSNPSTRCGQPNACASGRRSAITSGELAILGGVVGNSEAASGRLAVNRSHNVESDAHTSGRAPSRPSSHAGPRAAATSCEALSTTRADTHFPSTAGRLSVHRRARSSSAGNVAAAAMVIVVGAPEQPEPTPLPVRRSRFTANPAPTRRSTTANAAGATHRRPPNHRPPRCDGTSARDLIGAITGLLLHYPSIWTNKNCASVSVRSGPTDGEIYLIRRARPRQIQPVSQPPVNPPADRPSGGRRRRRCPTQRVPRGRRR